MDRKLELLTIVRRILPGIVFKHIRINTLVLLLFKCRLIQVHTTANLLIRSSTSKYVLFASANDVFVDNNAFIDMYSILEHEEDILLVYGRNSRDGHFSEPEEFSFSIPGSHARSELGICDNDCMNAATWLYTSSEPLWGLYRACLPRMIPAQPSYGADHVFIGLCALNGGFTV